MQLAQDFLFSEGGCAAPQAAAPPLMIMCLFLLKLADVDRTFFIFIFSSV